MTKAIPFSNVTVRFGCSNYSVKGRVGKNVLDIHEVTNKHIGQSFDLPYDKEFKATVYKKLQRIVGKAL